MHKILISFILALFFLPLSAQEYEVVSFEIKPNDLTARRSPRIDFNGKKCALIKVYTSDNISEVRGNIIGEIESSGMEKWIYVEDGTKQLEIIFDNHYPLSLVFENYDYPVLTQQMTYVLKLKDERESTSNIITEANVNNSQSNPGSSSLVSAGYANESELIKDMKKAYDNLEFNKTYKLAMLIPENGDAQYLIAKLYMEGDAVPQDTVEAVKWLQKATESGNAEATWDLAIRYFDGRGIKQDYNRYLILLHKASDSGSPEAMERLARHYESGDMEKTDMTKALSLYKMAADKGSAEAANRLGNYYKSNDYKEAVNWYIKAAENGSADAAYQLGNFFEHGRPGINKDLKEAKKWYLLYLDNSEDAIAVPGWWLEDEAPREAP